MIKNFSDSSWIRFDIQEIFSWIRSTQCFLILTVKNTPLRETVKINEHERNDRTLTIRTTIDIGIIKRRKSRARRCSMLLAQGARQLVSAKVGEGVLLDCVAGPVFHSGSLGSLTTSAKFLRTTAGVKPEMVSPG